MKKILSLILSLTFVLSLSPAGYAGEPEGDGGQGDEILSTISLSDEGTGEQPVTDPPVTDPPATNPPATDPPVTDPPATNPPATDPPATDPPASDPPATQPPATDPPATQPPATQPPATQPPATLPTSILPPATESHAITKHPTSETVNEGGYAEFVARADNCVNIIWHLQSPSGGSDILAQNAPVSFPGLEVSGLGSERLALNRIPKEMNEWRVRAEFVYLSGNSWSDAAVIYVKSQGLTPPTIQSQPQSASLGQGQTVSLQVSAQSPSQSTALTYQWYSNTVNSNSNGRAILGATSASYTPEYTPGTVYYYCAVRSSDGTNVSAATKTACAAVTYPLAATETTVQTTMAPTQPASAATLATWGAATENQEQTQPGITVPIATAPTRTYAKSNSLLVVIVAVIIIIAVAGVIAAVVILKYYSDREDEPRGRRKAPPAKANPAPRQQPKQPPKQTFSREEDPEWDDLSDLDLSYYLDDEDDL